jgi:hypothetical protein
MPRTAGAKKTRFTLFLPDDLMKDLSRYQESSGRGAIAEVVRDALRVYHSLLKAQDEGVKLYFEDEHAGEKGRIWVLPGPLKTTRIRR